MKNLSPILVWFRRDLRLHDHPALSEAAAMGHPIIPVFIWDSNAHRPWQPGAASRWWLHHSLTALDKSLLLYGSRLVIQSGPYRSTILRLAREHNAEKVLWNATPEPDWEGIDQEVMKALSSAGIEAVRMESDQIHQPGEVLTGSGTPYKVFTPFWKSFDAMPDPAPPLPKPAALPFPGRTVESISVEDLELLPDIPWDEGLKETWAPGESAARDRLGEFIENGLEAYDQARDEPGKRGTSRISASLHFGEISAREAWLMIRGARPSVARDSFARQLGWRAFSLYTLGFHPDSPSEPLREEFRNFPWEEDPDALEAWQQGRTGYPLVDAGMRELWRTGWMHNRVRMVAASFLVKHLLVPWQEGAKWFWDTLVDADLANNTMGWQWVAGCGLDAAPYFRIFNPITQSRKFDAKGRYIRKWVPEIAALPDRWIHAPWEAPEDVLRKSGIGLGRDYPRPIIDHGRGRRRALYAYASMKKKSDGPSVG